MTKRRRRNRRGRSEVVDLEKLEMETAEAGGQSPAAPDPEPDGAGGGAGDPGAGVAVTAPPSAPAEAWTGPPPRRYTREQDLRVMIPLAQSAIAQVYSQLIDGLAQMDPSGAYTVSVKAAAEALAGSYSHLLMAGARLKP